MAHLTFVAICPPLSENLSGFGEGGRRDAIPSPPFHDNAEVEKTNKDAGMAVRKPEKKYRFRNVRSRLEVGASARGVLVTVGPVTVLLDREAAQELTYLRVDALEPRDPLDIAGTGSN
jgi:hypothetical protein